MIPLYDNVPRVNRPYTVFAIIAINILIHMYLLSLSIPAQEEAIYLFGVVPARYFNPQWASWAGFPEAGMLPFLGYMFLHGDWLHLILNMWMMWIFADNIEDVTGPVRFLAFYLICGLVAVACHMFFYQGSVVPIIGASGAIAGVMGGYFVLYPQGRVLTLVFILFFRLRAVVFLGLWFAIQVLAGLAEQGDPASMNAEGVAWWAHAGGFVTGMALVRLFVQKGRCYYCYNPETGNYDATVPPKDDGTPPKDGDSTPPQYPTRRL